MRFILTVVAVIFGLGLVWLGIWHFSMVDDVARVKASIEYQNQRFKKANSYVTLKADSVTADGFPFQFRVKVVRPTLSMIFNKETQVVSFPSITLTSRDSSQGSYKVEAPATFDAMVAEDGKAPEKFIVTLNPMPGLLLRAQGNENICPLFPGGAPCPDAAPHAPLISYALQIPATIKLHIEQGSEKRDVNFQAIALDVPIFMDIPEDMGHVLDIATGVLQEAMKQKVK